MQCDLSKKQCKPCEGGVDPLSLQQAEALLKDTEGWQLNADATALIRKFEFKGFYKTMGFINLIAWVAQQEQHHPDVKYGYNYCEVTYTTHAINGLSENDFICAQKINKIAGF